MTVNAMRCGPRRAARDVHNGGKKAALGKQSVKHADSGWPLCLADVTLLFGLQLEVSRSQSFTYEGNIIGAACVEVAFIGTAAFR